MLQFQTFLLVQGFLTLFISVCNVFCVCKSLTKCESKLFHHVKSVQKRCYNSDAKSKTVSTMIIIENETFYQHGNVNFLLTLCRKG